LKEEHLKVDLEVFIRPSKLQLANYVKQQKQMSLSLFRNCW